MYIKLCRQKYELTQEELTQELYNFDESFVGLDTRTINRWENDKTIPSIERQIAILNYFQTISSQVLPCLEGFSLDELEEQISKIARTNIVGKNKEIVLNFPSAYIQLENLKIIQLKDSNIIGATISLALNIDKSFSKNYSKIQAEQFRDWSTHPSSFFLVCEYEKQFFGLLFALRLKPDIFNKIINFEMEEADLNSSHFANNNEDGCSYIIEFFAQSQEVASSLLIKYYTYLIANQSSILKIGVYSMMKEGKKIIERMNLSLKKELVRDESIFSSYEASLSDVLINETLLKMIFTK